MIKDTNKTLNDLLIDRLQNVYAKKPWYGRSFNELISDVDISNNEIRKLLLHILAWREYVIELLNGGQPTIEMNTNEDWPETISDNTEIRKRLEVTQVQLGEAFRSFDSSKWNELVWHKEYDYYYLANGIIDHDIYHIGQIVLQHKTMRSQSDKAEDIC